MVVFSIIHFFRRKTRRGEGVRGVSSTATWKTIQILLHFVVVVNSRADGGEKEIVSNEVTCVGKSQAGVGDTTVAK